MIGCPETERMPLNLLQAVEPCPIIIGGSSVLGPPKLWFSFWFPFKTTKMGTNCKNDEPPICVFSCLLCGMVFQTDSEGKRLGAQRKGLQALTTHQNLMMQKLLGMSEQALQGNGGRECGG